MHTSQINVADRTNGSGILPDSTQTKNISTQKHTPFQATNTKPLIHILQVPYFIRKRICLLQDRRTRKNSQVGNSCEFPTCEQAPIYKCKEDPKRNLTQNLPEIGTDLFLNSKNFAKRLPLFSLPLVLSWPSSPLTYQHSLE